jgi:hypothetical protein
MFDAPADVWYLWLGVGTVSVVALGVAVGLPATPPPDADRAVSTVDAVATSPHEATARYDVSATESKVGPHRLALRNQGGVSRSEFAYGPVTPVTTDERLQRVLDGVPPDRTFENATSFDQTAAAARNRTPRWERVDGSLLVRHVTWEGVDVTLVGT